MKGLQLLVERLWPGARIASVTPLEPDAATADETGKAAGYGQPMRIRVEHEGAAREYVFHTATANDFGHDRRADRAAELLLAWDTFGQVPGHAHALDVGAVAGETLISLAGAGEFYLLTEWAPGTLYAEELRRIAHEGRLAGGDLERAEALARYLVQLHQRIHRPAAYARALRDLVGHGECVFGIIDGYGDDTPAAPPERLQAIERRCLEWRWKLRKKSERLRRTHGDFHPFNVVFQEGTRFRVLDASRGSMGDAADDVAAMLVNFPFFAVERPASWAALGALYRRFLGSYLEGSGDRELLDVIAPFFAWRALVVSCPKFYPQLGARERDQMLRLAERALAAPRFDPEWAEELFR
jgi:hypothetical protein